MSALMDHLKTSYELIFHQKWIIKDVINEFENYLTINPGDVTNTKFKIGIHFLFIRMVLWSKFSVTKPRNKIFPSRSHYCKSINGIKMDFIIYIMILSINLWSDIYGSYHIIVTQGSRMRLLVSCMKIISWRTIMIY